MKKLWQNISYLGIQDKSLSLDQRSNILLNQINFVIALVMVAMLIVLRVNGLITNQTMGIGSLRVFLTLCLVVINLILAKFQLFQASKLSLIFLAPFVLVVFPIVINFVQEESYVYYHVILIGLSMVPALILNPKAQKALYLLAALYYLLLIANYDVLLNWFNPVQSEIFEHIRKFYLYYKIVPVFTFAFIQLAVYYIRNINFKFEKEISKKNTELDQHNEELKSTIDNLKMTQNQLVHAEKMAALGNLTAGISHEINNPLNYINGGLFFIEEAREMLAQKNADNCMAIDDLLHQSTNMVTSGVKRASQIVNLLTVFSLENKKEKQKINLSELLNGTICFITVKAKDTIKISKDFKFEGDVLIYHDQIHQAILNIFNNAVDAVLQSTESPKQKIEVKSYKEQAGNKTYAVIEIFNSGNPIPDSDLQKIFEPFQTTKDSEEHPGLGLSVAYSLVKKHNGTIEAVNRTEGVSFIIKLPV